MSLFPLAGRVCSESNIGQVPFANTGQTRIKRELRGCGSMVEQKLLKHRHINKPHCSCSFPQHEFVITPKNHSNQRVSSHHIFGPTWSEKAADVSAKAIDGKFIALQKQLPRSIVPISRLNPIDRLFASSNVFAKSTLLQLLPPRRGLDIGIDAHKRFLWTNM
jgi:hypothetical protein